MLRPDPIPGLKRQLADALVDSLRGWTAMQVYDTIRLDPPRLSELRRGRLQRFSAEKLIRLLSQRGRHITVTITTR